MSKINYRSRDPKPNRKRIGRDNGLAMRNCKNSFYKVIIKEHNTERYNTYVRCCNDEEVFKLLCSILFDDFNKLISDICLYYKNTKKYIENEYFVESYNCWLQNILSDNMSRNKDIVRRLLSNKCSDDIQNLNRIISFMIVPDCDANEYNNLDVEQLNQIARDRNLFIADYYLNEQMDLVFCNKISYAYVKKKRKFKFKDIVESINIKEITTNSRDIQLNELSIIPKYLDNNIKLPNLKCILAFKIKEGDNI